MAGFNPKWIVGKTVESAEMRPFDSGRAGDPIAHDPVIRFTDGSVIQFIVEETEGSEYGVDIVYTPASRRSPNQAKGMTPEREG